MRALLLCLMCWTSLALAQPAAPVVVITLNGALGPASADYIRRGLDKAAAQNAQLVVLKMDTPGGLDVSMRGVIKHILASPVPVASYVAPNGARAASAGTYILYASHIAAMAPATNLGAATPVAIGGSERAPPERKPGKDDGAAKDKDNEPQSSGSTMLRKQTNDAAAYIRGLAQLRGRNADWAERAVREAVSLSAQDALKLKVIDVIADDVPALLKQLDGRKLNVVDGERRLATAGAPVVEYAPDWRARFLAIITDPSIAYVLLMIGIYGLIFEFYSPGLVAPGVVGGICLVVGLFALELLPVNYAGLALIALGIGLMLAEHFAPGFGVLGLGGITAFVIGSFMLIDTESPGYRIPWQMITAVAAVSAIFLLVILRLAMTSRRRPPVSGREGMINATGEVLARAGNATYARVHGETWKVRANVPLDPGQKVRVVAIDGLELAVEPASQGDSHVQL